ncbi:MAG: hypothetical protein J6R10_02565 [Tidjanibacter sp.]|nr:hypothetical protein [Tidjanibacter sp.]
MSNVVNKLIFNCLVQYGNVALPEIGSLRVEGEPKQVFFSETISDNHIPVTDIMAEHGGISTEEAQRLYRDWLTVARQEDGTIVAEGVGVISPRRFDIDSELNRALNGDEALPVATLQRRRRGWIWWIVALIVVGGGVAAWLLCPCTKCAKCEAEQPTEEVVVEPAVEEIVEEVVPAVAEPKKATPPAPDKRYNVAVGVFSIKYNARACAKQDPLGIGAENYTITPFPSGLWVVIAYSTNNLNDAERMRKEYKKIQKDVWVYRRY